MCYIHTYCMHGCGVHRLSFIIQSPAVAIRVQNRHLFNLDCLVAVCRADCDCAARRPNNGIADM